MSSKKTIILIIIVLIVILVIAVIYLIKQNKSIRVARIIEGDTIIMKNGDIVRLLGINADEEGGPCFEQAKQRLEELVLNKKVRIEKDKTNEDLYIRLIRWVFIDDQNINLQMVSEGLANCMFYEPNMKYQSECMSLEEQAQQNKIGCEWQ